MLKKKFCESETTVSRILSARRGRKFIYRFLLFCPLFAVAITHSFAQKASDAVLADITKPLSLDVRQRTFEFVWKKIADTFYDPDFKGVNWNHVREKYLPEVEKTADSDEFHAVLNWMVKELKDSHLSVIPPPKIKGAQHSVSQASIGVDLTWIEKQILVTEIEPESPAARAGMKIGDSIRSVDGVSVERIFQEFARANSHNTAGLLAQQRAIAIRRWLNGAPNSVVKLSYRDGQNKTREVVLERAVSKTHGAIKPIVRRRLNDGSGYIKIPIFAGKFVEQLNEAFRELASSKSLIIDLRGNPGGAAQFISNLAGRLMERDGSLGESRYRNKKESLTYKGTGSDAYKGAVVVLIDEKSASASEVFAGALQDLGRGKVVGTRSGGAVSLSLFETLPTGGSLLYPIAEFFTPKGKRLEGHGVKPDAEVERTRRALIENRDLVLEKALALASKRNEQTSRN